jgi:16S rRNA (cytidine1402-2'-O)-methyltransferase
MSKLYVVGTPIGNLGDITFRAVEVLKSVDYIAAEDTRVAKKLLDHYEIHKPLLSYPSDDRSDRVEKIIRLLSEGNNIAFVSDAGTPGISDPVSAIVTKIRNLEAELPSDVEGHGIEIIPIPGPSALTTALSVAGLASSSFIFFGFLPHKKGRETLFKEIAEMERAVVLYESPHRILKTLESLDKFSPDKKVTIARELTKIYEEIIEGTPQEILKYYNDNKDKVKGEFVVIVSSFSGKQNRPKIK